MININTEVLHLMFNISMLGDVVQYIHSVKRSKTYLDKYFYFQIQPVSTSFDLLTKFLSLLGYVFLPRNFQIADSKVQTQKFCLLTL